jgi:hypothetical protein
MLLKLNPAKETFFKESGEEFEFCPNNIAELMNRNVHNADIIVFRILIAFQLIN